MPFLIFFNKFHILLIHWTFRKQSKGCHGSTQLKIISESLDLFLVSQIKWPREKRFYLQLRIPRFHKIKIFGESSLRSYRPIIREVIVPLPRLYLDINISDIEFNMCLPAFFFLNSFPAQSDACSFIKRFTHKIITNNWVSFLLLFQKHFLMSMNLFQSLLLAH